SLVPRIRASWPTTGADSARSRPLPWGRPSTMSTRTTSARPASAMRWAHVAPTLPAPMTVTLWRGIRIRSPFELDQGRAMLLVDARAGRPDRFADAVGKGLEVVGEHAGQLARLTVVGRRIGP